MEERFYTGEEVLGFKDERSDYIKKGEQYKVAVPRWYSHTDDQRYIIVTATEDMEPKGVTFTPWIEQNTVSFKKVGVVKNTIDFVENMLKGV